jgi:uncharacterized protein with FMN-binding domain
MYKKLILLMLAAALLIAACTPTPKLGRELDMAQLVDGVYDGHFKGGPNSVDVRVSIIEHKISNIEIIKHDAWKGHKADSVIPQRIIEKQSTDVDAVTGATNSSHVIMNAVQDAINKANKKEMTL